MYSSSIYTRINLTATKHKLTKKKELGVSFKIFVGNIIPTSNLLKLFVKFIDIKKNSAIFHHIYVKPK